jgi:DNA-binding transcriptional MerR regulator
MVIDQPISATELARIAGVSTQCIRDWRRAGLIPEPSRVSHQRVEFRPADALVVLAVAKARGH